MAREAEEYVDRGKEPAARPMSARAVQLAVVISLVFLLIASSVGSRGARAQPRPSCVNNLKQLGLVLHLYANENRDKFPPIDDTKNNFIFDADLLHPEYLTDAAISECPEADDYEWKNVGRLRSNKFHQDVPVGNVHPDCITDKSYIYLGWLVTSDEEAEVFFEAYDRLDPGNRQENLATPTGEGNSGSSVLQRLSSGVDRFLITDINMIFTGAHTGASEVPIIWDRPCGNLAEATHWDRASGDPGGHVLYLDGHVDFVKFGERFPMTETMARLLEERPHKPIPDCE